MERYLNQHIFEDLNEKMVFIGGPRQVGKTTLSNQVASKFFNIFEYVNWDVDKDRKKILELSFSPDTELIIFDEVHKYKNWKNHIKGFYDTAKDKYKIIVTGSARLDLYRKGGDSMMGRYHYHRLHPISYAEAAGYSHLFDIDNFEKTYHIQFHQPKQEILSDLFTFGGFPELFIKKNKRKTKRWQNERKKRMIKEDIRDTELIREFSLFQILVDILPSKIGSVFSMNSLREDINVTHQTLSKWMDLLDNFYYCFRIYPYNSSEIKSLKKEPKLYLWDYSENTDTGIKFENLIAVHLLKFVHHIYDTYGTSAELKYLRDLSKRETDFVIVIDKKPVIAVEVKLSSTKISVPLKYFKRKLNIPFSFQVVMEDNIDFLDIKSNIRVISASLFLSGLV